MSLPQFKLRLNNGELTRVTGPLSTANTATRAPKRRRGGQKGGGLFSDLSSGRRLKRLKKDYEHQIDIANDHRPFVTEEARQKAANKAGSLKRQLSRMAGGGMADKTKKAVKAVNAFKKKANTSSLAAADRAVGALSRELARRNGGQSGGAMARKKKTPAKKKAVALPVYDSDDYSSDDEEPGASSSNALVDTLNATGAAIKNNATSAAFASALALAVQQVARRYGFDRQEFTTLNTIFDKALAEAIRYAPAAKQVTRAVFSDLVQRVAAEYGMFGSSLVKMALIPVTHVMEELGVWAKDASMDLDGPGLNPTSTAVDMLSGVKRKRKIMDSHYGGDPSHPPDVLPRGKVQALAGSGFNHPHMIPPPMPRYHGGIRLGTSQPLEHLR